MDTARLRILSPDTRRVSPRDRTPPGQALTKKWPVLHHGSVPKVDSHSPHWRLKIFGLCNAPYDLAYADLRATDTPGFWEQNGYHMHGNPWDEERFGW